MQYEKYLNIVDEKKEIFYEISDTLWDNPETSFGEYQAVELLIKKLEKNGFEVTRSLCGIPTAFKATYGNGSPSLGVLAEYDALEDAVEYFKTSPIARVLVNNLVTILANLTTHSQLGPIITAPMCQFPK